MSDTEEREALAALRSITPSKDIVETVVSENNLVTMVSFFNCLESFYSHPYDYSETLKYLLQRKGNPKEKEIDLCESSEVVTKITDFSSASSSKHLC